MNDFAKQTAARLARPVDGLCMLLLAALLCGACGGSGRDPLRLNLLTVERHARLCADDDSPLCQVQLRLNALDTAAYGDAARAVNAAVATRLFGLEDLTLQQAADSFANSYLRSYTRDFAPLYREDKADPAKRAWYEYHYNVATDAVQKRDHTFTYLINIDYYEGGAHNIVQTLAMNFNAKTGQPIALADLFVPGYESRLSQRLLEALLDQTQSRDIDELHARGYLYSMDMFTPENFILADDDITFVYNPYELADQSKGIIRLTIDLDELSDIMKTE